LDSLNWLPSALHLGAGLWQRMLEDIIQRAPQEEACGLLSGIIEQDHYQALQVIPVTNQLHSPYRYNMAPQELLDAFTQIDKREQELIAIYHSHLKGPVGPSETDIAQAYYPECVYLIWSHMGDKWICNGYLIRQGQVRQIALVIKDLRNQ